MSNLGRNSRWYSGSGIYRHVTLEVTDPVRVGQWGVSITTPRVTKETATVSLATTGENQRNSATTFNLRIKLLGPAGKPLQTGETSAEVAGGARLEIPLPLEVKSPPLWSPDSPALCHAQDRGSGRRQSGGCDHRDIWHPGNQVLRRERLHPQRYLREISAGGHARTMITGRSAPSALTAPRSAGSSCSRPAVITPSAPAIIHPPQRFWTHATATACWCWTKPSTAGNEARTLTITPNTSMPGGSATWIRWSYATAITRA